MLIATVVGPITPAQAERLPVQLDAEAVVHVSSLPFDVPWFVLRVHTNMYSGQRIDMSALGVPICSDGTDRLGLALCVINPGTPEWVLIISAMGYDAVFAGDEYRLPASDHAPLLQP